MPADRPTREQYVHWEQVTTRWADIDVYGHMNNARYFEIIDTVVNNHLEQATGTDSREPHVGTLGIRGGELGDVRPLQPVAPPGGCVVVERFASPDLEGMSVSTFDAEAGAWKQTWVDNQGGYLDFVGGYENGRMVLSRVALEGGKRVHQRMVWTNVTPDAFDWSWERSEDGGATWKVVWPIHYTRRKG